MDARRGCWAQLANIEIGAKSRKCIGLTSQQRPEPKEVTGEKQAIAIGRRFGHDFRRKRQAVEFHYHRLAQGTRDPCAMRRDAASLLPPAEPVKMRMGLLG